jgi:tetratricopeptide (TPR) repeat protein
MLRSFVAAALGAALALALGAGASAQYANNLAACGSAYVKKDPPDQIRLYTLCIEQGGLQVKNRAGAYNNRGVAYLQTGEIDKALADFSASIRDDPDWGLAYLNRAAIRLQRGDLEGAEADLTHAATLPPSRDRGTAYMLRGEVRRVRGDYADALKDYRQAVSFERGDKIINNALAWLLATCPEGSIRNGKEATEIAQRIVRKEDSASARDTLAAAYAETGRFDDATREESQAIAMFKGPPAGAAVLNARLALYRSGKPYRDGQAP